MGGQTEEKEIGPSMKDFLHFTNTFIDSLEEFGPKTAEGGPAPRPSIERLQ